MRRIIARWQATYGRPSILGVPIAGCLTPRQGSSIQTSIPAVSAVRFAGSRSTRGLATAIFSIGKSIRRSRPSLGKGGDDQTGIPKWVPPRVDMRTKRKILLAVRSCCWVFQNVVSQPDADQLEAAADQAADDLFTNGITVRESSQQELCNTIRVKAEVTRTSLTDAIDPQPTFRNLKRLLAKGSGTVLGCLSIPKHLPVLACF